MALTPDDVVNKRFTITKFRDGYDLDQVDDFLDTIVEELRQLEAEREALKAENEELKAKLAAAESGAPVAAPAAATPAEADEADADEDSDDTVVVPSSLAESALFTDESASYTQGEAIKSSAMLQLALELHDKHIREGELKREQLVKDGEATAHDLVSGAQKQRADELAKLNHERTDLQQKIKDLREFEGEYRSTLRSYIQAQLRGLEGSPEPEGDPSPLS
ncbi:DivIVA domain-containing protein [Leucobacter sp. M11]|uniref:DivIVA domain-containing protein n=1 Tax=Leucobacter sp. M11 TaxID=2993565 RepID=UPI002D7FB060|nr:DivIVA domain-containing protein [Leucobacter sp. M11]